MQHPEAPLCVCVYACVCVCVCVWEGYWQRLAHLFRCSATLLVAPAGAHFHRFFLFPASFCVRMCRSVCVCVYVSVGSMVSCRPKVTLMYVCVCVCVCLGWPRVWLRIHFPFCQERDTSGTQALFDRWSNLAHSASAFPSCSPFRSYLAGKCVRSCQELPRRVGRFVRTAKWME